jgi:hypothetical protein
VNDMKGSKGMPLAMTRDMALQRGEDPDTAWPSQEGPESERRRKALIANV